MADRFLACLSAGVITAGMSAALLAGAGLAAAEEGSSTGTGGGDTSSASSNAPDSQKESPKSDLGTTDPSTDPADDENDDAADESDTTDPFTTDDTDETDENGPIEPTDDETTSDDETLSDDETVSDSDTSAAGLASMPIVEEPEVTVDGGIAAATEPEARVIESAVDGKPFERTGELLAAVIEEEGGEESVVLESPAADIIETPEIAAVSFASAPAEAASATATAPYIPGIIRVIGTIVFNLYGLATRLFGGPPILPPNSTVTVRSSTLRIDCGCNEGDGFEVPADWYIPAGADEDPPQRLIYFSHGFLAAGPWYSHTAAALAEQTNSIVVATSITSNFLAADACWLGAPPMQQAVAKLFTEGNLALENSADAAGYHGLIPDRVVLMGHSLGGGLVAGVAGYMSKDPTAAPKLAGVVMLDGVGLDDSMADSLRKVDEGVPIYQLAAPEYFWNQFGVGSDALLQARPGEFVGVTLVDGSHVDAMRGGNPLIQFAQELVAGFSTPENAAAAQIVMVGWVKDMFAGNQESGIYPTGEIAVLTPAGAATAVALPNTLTKPFLLNFLQPFVALGDGFYTFEPVCVAESMGYCEGSLAA
jgi:pimeloyl-ACP methyl ester carboxylesterase